MNTSTTAAMNKSRPLAAIFWGGLIAGTLDITYALTASALRGIGPVRILQSVASGLLGADSYNGGFATAALGTVLHFTIAFVLAALYFLVSRKLDLLVRRPVICGLLYGIAIYLTMNLVVLPLSAFPHKVTFVPVLLISGLLIHMFGIGLPIALATRRYSS
ncbi:MAG: hypothetical protein WCD76_18255 [Pyrinomonadaceae bacterium]